LLSNRGKGCVNDDISLTTDEEKRLITSDMPVEVKDIFLYPSIFRSVERGQFSFTLLMPMVSGEYLVGAIFIGRKGTLKGYDKNEKLLLAMICKQIAVVVHNSYLERELLKANNLKTDLYIKSITDPLTGLYHRAHLEFRLREDLKVSKRYGRPLSALMIEIDYFFQLSEMNGSQMTYHILQGVSKTIEKAIRIDVDLPARYSVDTIVVLLPETGAQGSMVLAERIRQKIADLHKIIEIENFPQVSVSIGVASLEDKEENVEDIILKLKEALEQAKNSGRNRVFLCQKNPEEKERVFSTFEMTSGMDSQLLISNIGNPNKVEDDTGKNVGAGTAYRAVEYYQKNVTVDWDPNTKSGEIKVKNANPDDFSYQPMMFLDFIDEEEKQQIKQQQEAEKLPPEAIKTSTSISKNTNVAALKYNSMRKTTTSNKFDNMAVRKTEMKHGRIPNKGVVNPRIARPINNNQEMTQEQQIHSLGFIDDI
jgi:diguanylate cyclase (GGDEF)-like protein